MNELHGRRILHILSPVQFEKGTFNHDRDSNYKCTERFIDWLPECHHYILVPEKHHIPDNRSNVTLLKYPYPTNAVSNRSVFSAEAFLKVIDMKRMDFDFLFVNQPELLYNVLVALMDRRYGEILHKFAFFHWVDCSASRGSPAIPHGYMRQLEAINLCTKFFVHSDIAIDYLASNFKKPKSVAIFHPFIEGKKVLMPTSKAPFGKPKPLDLPKDRRIVVFNHRWSQSTGVNRFLEYTKPLLEDSRYLLWVTDPTAVDLPKGYHQSNLTYDEYQYLLSQAYCSICFVDGYATWNLSVQDGIALNRPVLVYKHPVMNDVLGSRDYPYFFDTQEDFLSKLDGLGDTFKRPVVWPFLPDHDAVFKKNLLDAMLECVQPKGDTPKDAPAWLWYIVNGLHFKNDITNQVQENLQLNSVWQYIRRWLLQNGVTDNPSSPYTSYSIIPAKEAELKDLVKGLQLRIKAKTNKETVVNRKNHGFWD